MSHVASVSMLALAAIAREHSRPESLTKLDPVNESLAGELAGAMPCGVVRLDDESTGVTGRTFSGRHSIQRESLIAHFGETLPLIRVPIIPKACSVEFCEMWLRIQSEGAARDPRLKAGKGSIGRALPQLKTARALARISDEEGAPSISFLVHKATQDMASAMDSEFTDRNLEDTSLLTLGEEIFEGSVAKAADLVGLGIEKIAAPIVGAGLAATLSVLFSTLGPYLIVGGSVVYLARKGTI